MVWFTAHNGIWYLSSLGASTDLFNLISFYTILPKGFETCENTISIQESKCSDLYVFWTSHCGNTVDGWGPYIIFNGQINTAIKNCPYDPRELSIKIDMGTGVVRRKYVPLGEWGVCVRVWRQKNDWKCRWINRTGEVRELIRSYIPQIPWMHSGCLELILRTVGNPWGVLSRGVTAINFVMRSHSDSSVENTRDGTRLLEYSLWQGIISWDRRSTVGIERSDTC